MKSIPVTKIEIKQEKMIVNQPTVKFAKVPPYLDFQRVLEEGEPIPNEPIGLEEIYQVREVIERGNRRNYLVKVGEEELFNDLLCISNDDIERIKLDAFYKGEMRGYYKGNHEGIKEAKKSIKQLSRWKRLFNKF